MSYADPIKQKEYQRLWIAERKKFLKTRLGNRCVDCGTNVDLEFDHVDQKSKKFTVMQNITKSLDVLIEEVDKCELRCKPCHLKRSKTQPRPGIKGEKHVFSKMPKNLREEIRVKNSQGMSCRALAKEYGIHHTNIAKMLRGFSYSLA